MFEINNNNILKGLLPLIVIFFAIAHPQLAHAEEKHIRFAMSTSDYPPYQVIHEDGAYGIVVDAILRVSKSIGYSVTVSVLPVKRLRQDLQEGRIDAVANALEWWKVTPDAVWSSGIMRVADNVVMVKGHPQNITATRDLVGKHVGLMKDYVYPSLEPMIKEGSIKVQRVQGHDIL